MDVIVTGIKILDLGRRNIDTQCVKLYRKHSELKSIHFDIKTYNAEGWRSKFSINLKAITEASSFKSNAHDWLLNLAVKDALHKLRIQLSKAQEKQKSKSKRLNPQSKSPRKLARI